MIRLWTYACVRIFNYHIKALNWCKTGVKSAFFLSYALQKARIYAVFSPLIVKPHTSCPKKCPYLQGMKTGSKSAHFIYSSWYISTEKILFHSFLFKSIHCNHLFCRINNPILSNTCRSIFKQLCKIIHRLVAGDTISIIQSGAP